jgi:hypothetical protein
MFTKFFRQMFDYMMWPFKVLTRTLQARVGCLTWVLLLICIITVYIILAFDPFRVPLQHALSWWRIILVTLLWFAIPISVWYTIKLWLTGDVSPYRDIQFAWKQGMEELRKNGLDIRQIPVFLIVGSGTPKRTESLMDASRLSFRIKGTPEGPSPIHWYANPDGIYIVLTGTGCLGALAAKGEEPKRKTDSAESVPGMGDEPPAMAGTPGANLPPAPSQPRLGGGGPEEGGGRPSARGTMVMPAGGGDANDLSGPAPRSARVPMVGGAGRNMPAPTSSRGGTMILQPGTLAASEETQGIRVESADEWSEGSPDHEPIALTPSEANEQTRRLEYLCHLVKQTRGALAPTNGLLALLPMSVLRSGSQEGLELQRALNTDLTTMMRILRIRCPATAVVVGMENERGFRELVRRVGTQRAAEQRFGKGFDLWTRPSVGQVEALCAHACEAFESWIYALFREPGSLSKPGNTRLYMLLCQVRRTLQTRLAGVLTAGFADNQPDKSDIMLFGGCYFAAVGNRPEQQAFIKAVFDKLLDQQEEVEWSERAVKTERRQYALAWTLIVLDIVLFTGLIGYTMWSLGYFG